MEGFHFSYPIQLRWSDLDPLGHVNNATFVTYFEIARGRFMLHVCPHWDWRKDMFLIGNVTVDFTKELTLHSPNTQVHMRTSKLGTKSFVLEYVITSGEAGKETVHAKGSTTQIMFDMQSRQTIAIPEDTRSCLQEFDKLPA